VSYLALNFFYKIEIVKNLENNKKIDYTIYK